MGQKTKGLPTARLSPKSFQLGTTPSSFLTLAHHLDGRVAPASEREAPRLGRIDFLGQGTIYPDVIESAGTDRGGAAIIKHHHNAGGLPSDMGFELVEPLRNLFKDEVRRVGERVGLPRHLVWRHPFPGPGLAVRILGEVTWERLETLRQADAIFLQELETAGWYDQIAQAFAVLLPETRSTGVAGDAGCFGQAIVLRAGIRALYHEALTEAYLMGRISRQEALKQLGPETLEKIEYQRDALKRDVARGCEIGSGGVRQ